MKKEVKKTRESLSKDFELLDDSIKKRKKKLIESNLLRAIVHMAILGNQLGITSPDLIVHKARDLLKDWYNEKTKKETSNLSVKNFYKNWAKNYDVLDNIAIYLEEKNIKSWFKFKGKDILDLGCGTGRYTIPLAKKNNLTAIDFSKSMLNNAKKKAKKKGVKIDFEEGDVTKFKSTKKFDVIISMLVQDHIKDLNKIGKVMDCITKKGSLIIISNIHPLYTYDSFIRGDKAELLPGKITSSYYHPLEQYLNIFRKFGFELIDYKDLIIERKHIKMKQFKNLKRFENKPFVAVYKFKKMSD